MTLLLISPVKLRRTRTPKNTLRIATLFCLAFLFGIAAPAQTVLELFDRNTPDQRVGEDLLADPRLEPFYHGVASGDPSPDGIILWTRVTPESAGPLVVSWELSADTAFSDLVQLGSVVADSSSDYTVNVPLSGLAEGTTYYYRFRALGKYSIIGRTRTASQDASQLRFAVVSCNNYPSGYFSSFGRIAERNDLDAVIHLGDFIYEYAEGEYGTGTGEGREMLEPENEILSLEDYRQRYAWYRLDPDLRRAMQQHPFIFVWDDHESANNSWTGGAQNHDPLTEGEWDDRRQRAAKVYFEWTPIRDDADYSIYRTFTFGDLAELRMLDTRLEGREEQLTDHLDPQVWAPDRTLLGEPQLEWFTEGLTESDARWKLVGNQVVFSPMILENFEAIYPGVQNQYLDTWMGYPGERTKILDTLEQNNINDVVFLTGDVHISLAFDVPEWDGDSLYYDATDGSGSRAVEFVCTSISSDNFDEVVGLFLSNLVEGLFKGENPHAAYNEFDRHGYFVLDLTDARAQADYFYVPTKLEQTLTEAFDQGWYTMTGENHLRPASGPAPPKPVQEIPAPDPTQDATGLNGVTNPGLFVWNIWPNPVTGNRVNVAFTLNMAAPVSLYWTDLNKTSSGLLYQGSLSSGHYTLELDLPAGAAGPGFLEFRMPGHTVLRKIVRF